MNLPPNLLITGYAEERALELVKMWRASFERGVGVVDPHPLEEQLAYLQREVAPANQVLLAVDGILREARLTRGCPKVRARMAPRGCRVRLGSLS